MEAVNIKSFEFGAWRHVPFKNEAEGVIVTVIAQTGLVKHVIRMAPPQFFVFCHFRVATQGERKCHIPFFRTVSSATLG